MDGYYLDPNDLYYKECYKKCKTCKGKGDEKNNNCIEYYKIALLKEMNNNEYFNTTNLTSNEINKFVYEEIINVLQDVEVSKEEDIIIETKDNTFYQVTTLENEANLNAANSRKVSKIDLGDCENKLRKAYNLNENISLIMVKFEKVSNSSSERSLQYEIYEPINKTKLDLSVCKDVKININVPVVLNGKMKELHDELKNLGYDIFDPNSAFYKDICIVFKSSDGTDVPLSERVNNFFQNAGTQCQTGCHFSEYSVETQNLKCECTAESGINTEKAVEIVKEVDTKTIIQSFYEVLKYSNYKILKCYKLPFSINIFRGNKGNYISLAYFVAYLTISIIYLVRKKDVLKEDLSKLVCKNLDEKPKMEMPSGVSGDKLGIPNNPNNLRLETGGKTSDRNLKILNDISNKLEELNKNTLILKKNIRRKSTRSKIIFDNPPKKNLRIIYNFNNKNKLEEKSKEKNESNNIKEKSPQNIINDDKKILDNYELNNLEYEEALKLDKRNFIEIYWSLLKRQHPILFTFVARNDHNNLLIKFSRFIFSLCTDMALNAFFFSDQTMHKMYLNYGKYNFVQQIPQILYSAIFSQIIDTFLCYLSLTDKYYYQIKKMNIKSRILLIKIIKVIRIKTYFFFVFTGIMFVFYWYIITCFCEIYANTQIAFIKDSFLSFGLGSSYPFALYLFPTILRLIALKFCEGKLSFIYKMSDVIPFF